jgi:predicted permease
VLLTGAGLALRSFERLTSVDPGFDAGHVLTFNVQLPDGTYPTFDSDAAFFRSYTQQLQQQPGIVAAGAVLFPPLDPTGFGGTVTFPGRSGDAAEGSMQVRSVTPGYFDVLRIPLRAGRLPQWSDVRGGAGVVVISDAAARKYFPGENPVGQKLHIRVSMGVRETQPREIIGVVGDVRVYGLDVPIPAVAYVPQDQYATSELTVMVRTAGEPMSVLPVAQSVLAGLDPGLAMSQIRPFAERVRRSVAAPRFRMTLLGVFAVVSLVLAAVGIYGTLAFSVNQRRAEIGLRMALGAHGSSVMRMVVREGLAPVAVGVVAGLTGAALLTRVLSALLYGVSSLDPLTFLAVALVLGLVALVACYVPARRAVAVDPVTALRT